MMRMPILQNTYTHKGLESADIVSPTLFTNIKVIVIKINIYYNTRALMHIAMDDHNFC